MSIPPANSGKSSKDDRRYTFSHEPRPQPATEARIQAELATGRYAAPDELLNRALDSLNASLEADRAMNEPAPKEMEDWLLRNKDAVNAALDESFAAKERGDSYSMEEAEAILAERRAARSRQAA